MLRIFENNVFKIIGKTSVTLGTMASMATASGATATIHSEVGAASKVATALLALLPQP